MNFAKLYIGDYIRDTGTLTVAQHGAYLLMLLEFYATERPIPEGPELHRLLRAQTKAEREAIDFVAAKFWQKTDTGLVNARGLTEIERAANQRAVNQEIGKRGGRPKRTEHGTESVTGPEPNRNPNQTPDTRHQEEAHASSARGRVGKALKAGGMDLGRVNLSDPRLSALIDQGATPEEFEGIAKEAVAAGKGFAWVLTVLQSRRAEAAAIALAPKAAVLTPWHETRSGIEAKGAALGLGKWDEEAFAQGRGEQWPAYRNRVFKAAGHTAMERVA